MRYLEDRDRKSPYLYCSCCRHPLARTPIKPGGIPYALDFGGIDLAILPYDPPQKRFHAVPLYAESFVFLTRAGHALADGHTVEALAECRHVLVSATGDTTGFVDSLTG